MSAPATTLPEPKKIGMVSLGCPKALVDSERILTRLRADGYAMSPDYAGADVVIEVSGAIPALNEAIRSAAYSSRVVAMGRATWWKGPSGRSAHA